MRPRPAVAWWWPGPRPDAPPVTTATASLISTERCPFSNRSRADQLIGWETSRPYPVPQDRLGVGAGHPRWRRRAGLAAGEARCGPRLQAVGARVVERVALGDVRFVEHLAERQHRRHAGIGAGEHLGPVVAVVLADGLGQRRAQFRPPGDVVLRGQFGGVRGRACRAVRRRTAARSRRRRRSGHRSTRRCRSRARRCRACSRRARRTTRRWRGTPTSSGSARWSRRPSRRRPPVPCRRSAVRTARRGCPPAGTSIRRRSRRRCSAAAPAARPCGRRRAAGR